MANIKVVTGYVPLKDHPRSAKEYGDLGEQIFKPLASALIPIVPFYEPLTACWLWNTLRLLPYGVTPCVADNPKKNTLAYHCVQHQKFRWLCYAAFHDNHADSFVWIDYGIGHVPGVTAEVIYAFLENIKKDDLAIPGCWPKNHSFNTTISPSWRFCGGLMVVPRRFVNRLYELVREEAIRGINIRREVTWEVNTLAAIESGLPIRWFQADHNASMFENYSK